jgi:RNA polymerase sigma-70 factor, ECF subfamily
MSLIITKYKILIRRYKDKIFSYALYMVKNRFDAEDITQEVMIRIWMNINSFKVRSASSYIMRITHNLCIDYLRVRKSTKRFITLEEGSENERIIEYSSSPEDLMHIKMMSQKLHFVIRELPENLKSPFVMYELNGIKYSEISRVLDIPLNTVKVNILRARKKIKEKLNSYEKHEVL